jgi:hypothetical protein
MPVHRIYRAYDSEVHAALLKAYDKWDTVMMPVHAAEHAREVRWTGKRESETVKQL